MYYIGVDLGTSAVKLLLMTGDGVIHNIVSREYPLSMPKPGWSEQDPADWRRETLAGIRELTKDIDRRLVAGIGVGGQMHGLVALDKADRVLRPAILWNDGRTAAETAWLNRELGEDTLAARTGNIAFAGFTAPKLLWMRANEPSLFEKVDKVMLPKDYLVYLLTGVHAADCSDAAGTLLFDVGRRCWSPEMLAVCGLRLEQMGHVYESSQVVGTLLPALAKELDLPETVKVVAGAGDNAAAAVGTGTVGKGRCNLSVGTSGTIFLSDDRYVNPRNHAVHAFCHADGGWHLMGVELSAASCNKWWSDILETKDFAAQQAAITADRLGRNRVYFLPYLMGERTPHNDALARAAFLGMTMDTSRADMTQAVLEGVAFGLRDGLEAARDAGIQVSRSRLCGGGAKSPVWQQILADVLNLELELLETEQGPGLGGAMLAAVGCGEYASVREAADAIVRITGTVKPDPEAVARYDARYETYRALYPALKPLFPQMQ